MNSTREHPARHAAGARRSRRTAGGGIATDRAGSAGSNQLGAARPSTVARCKVERYHRPVSPSVVVRHPVAELAPFVESFWYFAGELAQGFERVLPTGKAQLLVNLHEDELRWYD